VKQWKGHDEEEWTKEKVEKSLLVFSKPTKFVKHVIKVFPATLLSKRRTRLQILWLAHGSKIACNLLLICAPSRVAEA